MTSSSHHLVHEDLVLFFIWGKKGSPTDHLHKKTLKEESDMFVVSLFCWDDDDNHNKDNHLSSSHN